MRHKGLAISAAVLFTALVAAGGRASEIQAASETITMKFGQAGNTHGVDPATIELKRGAAYVLVISNQSGETHYVSPTGFSSGVKTLSLNLKGGGLKSVSTFHGRSPNPLGSLIGKVEEIEIRSGGEATWRFVAVVPGTYQIECGVPSHAAAGMKASVIIR